MEGTEKQLVQIMVKRTTLLLFTLLFIIFNGSIYLLYMYKFSHILLTETPFILFVGCKVTLSSLKIFV